MGLLDVQELRTYYTTLRGNVRAVDGVTFTVKHGEATGLAGESGCGKTTVATSILRILSSGGKIVGGKILFNGLDIVGLDEVEMRERIRWKEISIVFQGAMNALNPVFRVSDQIVEAITLHEPEVSRKAAYERAEKLFELVGIDSSRVGNYPHEFSGGMRQRAMIAMALASNPSVLIADEPATALDVIVAAQVLKLMRELKSKLNLGMILITHDLSIIAEVCEICAIMYAGKIAEYGNVVTIFKDPLHPYTQGLMSAFPSINAKERMRMVSIPGAPPDLLDPPNACRFNPRCRHAKDICRSQDPPYTELEKGHFVSCHMAVATYEGKKW
ncbi:ABC transporter ATP-binding protein [Candidatus Bathyarchaeota archaeon]|nr:ABC transporter ATP-binding protein [Candidatus Bathyarchaeota archaeon]